MSIRVDLSAPDVDRQLELLKVYPEIADRHYRPVLQKDVKILAGMVQPNIPERTGRARATFGSRVIGKGTSITGEVGWYRKGSPFYIGMIEGGTKVHEIGPRGSKVTLKRFLAGSGGTDVIRFLGPNPAPGSDFAFVRKSFQHPGTSARGFMQSAWAAAQPLVEHDIFLANEAVLKELSVP